MLLKQIGSEIRPKIIKSRDNHDHENTAHIALKKRKIEHIFKKLPLKSVYKIVLKLSSRML